MCVVVIWIGELCCVGVGYVVGFDGVDIELFVEGVCGVYLCFVVGDVVVGFVVVDEFYIFGFCIGGDCGEVEVRYGF